MCKFQGRVGQGSMMGVTKAGEERITLGTEEKHGQCVGIKAHCHGREVVTPL